MFIIFNFDIPHMSFMYMYFLLTCITGIQNSWDIIINSNFQNFIANLSPTDFPISQFVFIFVPHRNPIHNYGTFLPIMVWLNRQLAFLMGLQCCHIQDPFASCTFNFNQPKKLLVSHAHIFLLHLYNVITNNFIIVHTNNQIHFLKKEIPFLSVWLNRQLVFLMGL